MFQPAPSEAPAPVCRMVRSGRVWLCDDDFGVSRAISHALAQDRRGYLWVGSEAGPVIFDGLVWSSPPSLASLGSGIVKALAHGPDDRMWVGTDGAGLACVDLDTLPYHPVGLLGTAEGLPSARVHALLHDPHDSRHGLWVGTHAGLALVRDGAVERVLTVADGLPSPIVWSLCADRQGRLWAGTKGGLAIIDGDTILRHPSVADPLLAQGVQQVRCDSREQVWVGLVGGGVLRAEATDDGSLHLNQVHDCGARVRALCPDADGRLWVGTSAGVLCLKGDRLVDSWGVEDGLPAQQVWALYADREGRMWASTSTGLTLLEDRTSPVRALPPATGRAGAPVNAVAPDRQGRMWVGTETGLGLLDSSGACALPLPLLPEDVARDTIWALCCDRLGQLWVGTDCAGLFCIDPDSGAVRAHIALAKQAPALYLVGERQLWASLIGYGLVCIDIETHAVIHRLGAADGLPQDNVQGLQLDAQGRLWAGTWSGWLACIDPARGVILTTLCLNDEQARRPVSDMCRDPTGMLWVSAYGGGLVCVDPARVALVRVLTTEDDLPSTLLYACRADDHGHIWAGTRRGVARYTPETGRCIVIGRSLGLPSEECNARGLYLDAHDHLWVGVVQGGAVIDTTRIVADVPPSQVHLTGFSVMGQDRPFGPGLEIEDSDYDLVFTYGAVTFAAAPQVAYRVQLVGLEDAWSAPTPYRFARYTNLRPGDYTFRVAARNWGGQWGAPVEVPFRIVRNRKAREMEDAPERERIDKEVYRATAGRLGDLNGRLQELNRRLEETDQLKTTLIQQTQEQAALFERLSLQDGLTGLLNRRALDARLAEECGRARRYGRALTVIMADLDHFKSINDTYGHQVGDQVLKTVAQLCQDIARSADSVGRYGGEEIAFLLPETATAEGLDVCERLRAAIADHDWARLADGLRVTISVGVAGASHASQPEALLAGADDALYRAKAEGRDRVVCAPEAPPVVGDTAWSGLGPEAQAPVIPAVAPPPLPRAGAPPSPDAALFTRAAITLPAVLTDELTGLGSYRAFQEDLGQAVARAQSRGEPFALARLDLDEFAALNLQHGPVYGDVVLSGLAAVLRGGRPEDRAYRLGGDEFALLLPGADLTDAVAAMERLRAQAARCLAGTTVSAGIAALASDAPDRETLLAYAEAALGEAKRRGRNLVAPFAQAGASAAVLSPAKVAATRRLLNEGRLDVSFQPIWDVQRGVIFAYEALMRPAPDYGLAGPEEAFEIAEKLGHVHTLDALCRRAALTVAGALPPQVLLFLNLSPHTVDHDLLAGTALADAVVAAGLTPARVVLEITERAVARPGVVVRETMRLRAAGFRVALDDTGAGNAGLEMLSQMPVDFVKIDREVVTNAPWSTPARAVLAGILAIAREMGPYVIAEGIETADMLRFVRDLGGARGRSGHGVQGAQGYFLGRPCATLPDVATVDRHTALITAA